MVREENIRVRLSQNKPSCLLALDYLAGKMAPYEDGHGWTVFNDWLDRAYRHFEKRPPTVPFVSLEAIRVAVFPGCA